MLLPRPVVKWAGGKQRLLKRLVARLPEGPFDTYAEPFCGGAAMFFHLCTEPKRRFKRALLADKNPELVALYQAIKADVEALIRYAGVYQDTHLSLPVDKRREHFYEVRALGTDGMRNSERGARLLFLNRTCFNGLWRVNASGQFNVPFGRYEKPKILDEQKLRAAHEALSAAEVRLADFSAITKQLEGGDFAYFDPPYAPLSNTANFTAYAQDRFGQDEQERLAVDVAGLHKKGVRAMLSNASTPEIEALYRGHGFVLEKIHAARAINSDTTKRGEVKEIVATTYSIRRRKVVS